MKLCQLFGGLSRMIPWHHFAFIAAFMLFINKNQAQILKRRKQCGTGADNHIQFTLFGPLALIEFLPGR